MFETSKEKAKELTEGDEILMRYNEKVEEAQKDEELLQAYDHDEVHFELGREEGIKMGITQGIAQGIKKNQIEVIENMMDEGFGKETIAKCLKIDMEELERVLSKIKN
ncbi:MAG TPA: hypothetical protein DCY94_00130 [Firmicutes bacterium]|nr:hypothetical protein [Bacillota bacterium]